MHNAILCKVMDKIKESLIGVIYLTRCIRAQVHRRILVDLHHDLAVQPPYMHVASPNTTPTASEKNGLKPLKHLGV